MNKEDESWEKTIGQYRLAIHEVMRPLRLYGQNIYVDSVTEELVSLALQLHGRLEGIDEPYHINRDKLHY